MKRKLLGAFYTLQGLSNFVLTLFFITGGAGGGGFFAEILVKGFLLLASCLSVFAALTLFLKRDNWARVLGGISSFFFGAFYMEIALMSYSGITQKYYSGAAIGLLLSISIVLLNAVSFFSLYKMREKVLSIQVSN